MKSVWLSVLNVPEQEARGVIQKMQTYGLSCSGHQWTDNTKEMAWMGPKEVLCGPQVAFWAILAAKATLMKPETRYGLSLLALCVQAERGEGFPIVILQTDEEAIGAEDLPTPLRRAVVLPADGAGTPAKLVAKAHAKTPEFQSAYRFDMVGDPQLGQWFEVRPTRDSWPGIIFGIDDGEIKFQAVGPSGELPKTSTLNYPMQGLEIDYCETKFTAWAVRNELSIDTSYFVKVDGAPGALLFGPFSEESETEMYRVCLK